MTANRTLGASTLPRSLSSAQKSDLAGRRALSSAPAVSVFAQLAALAAFGVGLVETEKSAELLSVSWPSGRRMALEPGLAEVGGAVAADPSPSPLAVVP